jgi:hypothetical protein
VITFLAVFHPIVRPSPVMRPFHFEFQILLGDAYLFDDVKVV